MNKSSLLIVVLLLIHTLSPAGEAPKVRFPTGDVEWTVDIAYAPGVLAAPIPAAAGVEQQNVVHPARIQCTSAQGIKRYRISWSDRSESEVWQYRGATMLQDRATGEISHDSASLVPGLIIRIDASLFDWIGSGKPPVESKYQERPCLLYEIDALPGELGPGNISDDFYVRRAWVDPETKLPLAYDNSIATYRFTFSKETPAPLKLPSKFAEAYQTVRNSISQPPAWAAKAVSSKN